MKASQWIDRVKRECGWDSDYRVAKELGITKAAISRYRSIEDSTLSDEVAIKVAALLNIDPRVVIAGAHAKRAKTDGARKFWERFGTSAGVVAFVAAAAGAPSRVDAKAFAMIADDAGHRLYIMSNHLRRLLRALRSWLAIEPHAIPA